MSIIVLLQQLDKITESHCVVFKSNEHALVYHGHKPINSQLYFETIVPNGSVAQLISEISKMLKI